MRPASMAAPPQTAASVARQAIWSGTPWSRMKRAIATAISAG